MQLNPGVVRIVVARSSTKGPSEKAPDRLRRELGSHRRSRLASARQSPSAVVRRCQRPALALDLGPRPSGAWEDPRQVLRVADRCLERSLGNHDSGICRNSLRLFLFRAACMNPARMPSRKHQEVVRCRPHNKALHQTRRRGVPASRAVVEGRLAGEGWCYAGGRLARSTM